MNTGYNYMLSNRFRIGVEADASFPAWPSLAGFFHQRYDQFQLAGELSDIGLYKLIRGRLPGRRFWDGDCRRQPSQGSHGV